jgi:hypothetical protein
MEILDQMNIKLHRHEKDMLRNFINEDMSANITFKKFEGMLSQYKIKIN